MAKEARDARKIEVGFTEASANRPASLTLSVPAGLNRAELAEVIAKVFDRSELERFRPRGCLTCISGLDLNIRERFENVLTFEI